MGMGQPGEVVHLALPVRLFRWQVGNGRGANQLSLLFAIGGNGP